MAASPILLQSLTIPLTAYRSGYFGEELATVMNKMLLISEVSALAKFIEKSKITNTGGLANRRYVESHRKTYRLLKDGTLHDSFIISFCRSGVNLQDLTQTFDTDQEDDSMTHMTEDDKGMFNTPDLITGSFRTPERDKLMRLLGHWEEPESSYSTNQVSSFLTIWSHSFFCPDVLRRLTRSLNSLYLP